MLDATAAIRGVTIGLPPYVWTTEPTGLLSTAYIRAEDRDRPNRDGVIAGADYLGGKLLTFELAVVGASPADCEQLAAALATAFAPSRFDVPLDARVTGTPAEYRLIGRPRGAEVVLGGPNELYGGHVAYVQCRFVATDPIRYALDESSLALTLDTLNGGLTYPVEYPIVYGSGGGAGQGDAVNIGSADVDWTAQFAGPLVNPRLEHINSGRFFRVAASIAAGQSVTLDSRHGAVLLNGTTPRPAWAAPGSSWFRLATGSNLLRFNADSGSGSCTVVWRSGWA